MPCKPVFLYYYYLTKFTKWNYLNSKLELEQMECLHKNTNSPQTENMKISQKYVLKVNRNIL